MLFIMVPAAILLGIIGLIFLIWSVKTGQFEDMEGPKHRIFFDEDERGASDRERENVE